MLTFAAFSPRDQSVPLAVVWVSPTDGVDPVPTSAAEDAYVGDPSLKFKTMQAAIDAVQRYLVKNYDPQTNQNQEGLVYALPGLYGPHGANVSSNDTLPIQMRDRVHVQGLGTRRCVIRGASTLTTPQTNTQMHWPNAAFGGSDVWAEVLVTFETSTPGSVVPVVGGLPPWHGQPPFIDSENVAEVFDAFTLEGGDVQILSRVGGLAPFWFPAFRVSHCVFDLRHDWVHDSDAHLAGPYFGIMMSRRSTYFSVAGGEPVGYLDGRTLIANNSFIFARWNGEGLTTPWTSRSRDETVGIIDVTHPACTSIPDPDDSLRGVGHPCIVSNLFRTAPQAAGTTARPFAMLGVSDDDTRVWTGSSFVQTNAFDPSRVGSTNASSSGVGFYSQPVQSVIVDSAVANGQNDVWNCSVYTFASCTAAPNPPPCNAASAPTNPAVRIWDGTVGNDPAFVGEYIATMFAVTHPSLAGYVDWRILPESPLENMGYAPPPGSPRYFQTQVSFLAYGGFNFSLASPPELFLFAWDGEHWGNPGDVNDAPDIGFDERHLLICAGSWSNDSNSHNVPGFMHPGLDSGIADRFFILPRSVGTELLNAPNRSLAIHRTSEKPPGPPSIGNAWVNPPQSLAVPPVLGSLPQYHRTKYISFAGPLAPWTYSLGPGPATSWQPLGGVIGSQISNIMLLVQPDDECSPQPCAHEYFNMQAVELETSSSLVLLRSNMQGEFR